MSKSLPHNRPTRASDKTTNTDAMEKPKWKPHWIGSGRHPLEKLHVNQALAELVDRETWWLKQGDFDNAGYIDRDIDRALAKGVLPAQLGKRIKRVTAALRRFEALRRDLIDVDQVIFKLAEIAALQRARRSGRYDAADLDEQERRLRAEHAEDRKFMDRWVGRKRGGGHVEQGRRTGEH